MEAFIERLIDWFALPRNGLSSVFLIALVSATLLPLGSEPAVFGYVKLNPGPVLDHGGGGHAGQHPGRGDQLLDGSGGHEAVAHGKQTRYLHWFERLGPKACFFSFLPAVGDPLCAVAGWLKLPFWACAGWMALGKLIRYVLMTGFLLWVPDGWWRALLGPLARVIGL